MKRLAYLLAFIPLFSFAQDYERLEEPYMSLQVGSFSSSSTSYDFEGLVKSIGATGYVVDSIQSGDIFFDDNANKYRVDSISITVPGDIARLYVTDLASYGTPIAGRGSVSRPSNGYSLSALTPWGNDFLTPSTFVKILNNNFLLLDSLIEVVSVSGDDWGTQVVEADATLNGNGTTGSPLGADTSVLATRYWVIENGGVTDTAFILNSISDSIAAITFPNTDTALIMQIVSDSLAAYTFETDTALINQLISDSLATVVVNEIDPIWTSDSSNYAAKSLVADTAAAIRADFPDVSGFIDTEIDPQWTSDSSNYAAKALVSDTAAAIRADFPDVSGFIDTEIDPQWTSDSSNYVAKSLLADTAAAIRADFPVGDGADGVVDTIVLRNDSVVLARTESLDSLSFSFRDSFDSDRNILRVPSVGDNIGGATIWDWINWHYFTAPDGSLSVSGGTIFEVGTSNSITVSGSVTNPGAATLSNGELVRTTPDGAVVDNFGTGTSYSVSFTYTPQQGGSGVYNQFLYRFRANQDWSGAGESGNWTSPQRTIQAVYPVLWGMSSTDLSSTGNPYSELNKLVQTEGNKTVTLNGTGFIYYAVPTTWNDTNLSSIIDHNGFDVTPSFTSYNIQVSSSGLTNNWTNVDYVLYKLNTTTTTNNFAYEFNR